MKETLERLWYEYFLEECAVIDTDEERELSKKVAEMHKKASTLLNKEQEEAVEKYADALYRSEALFMKKAFFCGCEFAISFLFETVNPKNRNTGRH